MGLRDLELTPFHDATLTDPSIRVEFWANDEPLIIVSGRFGTTIIAVCV